jgi:uncharacterized membrane protein
MAEKKTSLWSKVKANLRGKLVAGVIALIPAGITFLMLTFIFDFAKTISEPAVRRAVEYLTAAGIVTRPLFKVVLEYSLIGVGVAFTMLAVYLVGAFATNVFGRRIIGFWESLLVRIPLVRKIYTATKQIVESIASTNGSSFKRVVLVEYPRRGAWVVAFVTNSFHSPADGRELVNLFVPTVPNPTSGWMALVPEDEVVETDLTVEEALRIVFSAGVLMPVESLLRRKGRPAE